MAFLFFSFLFFLSCGDLTLAWACSGLNMLAPSFLRQRVTVTIGEPIVAGSKLRLAQWEGGSGGFAEALSPAEVWQGSL